MLQMISIMIPANNKLTLLLLSVNIFTSAVIYMIMGRNMMSRYFNNNLDEINTNNNNINTIKYYVSILLHHFY